MKEIVTLLKKKGEIFPSLKMLELKEYGFKKRWKAYEAVNQKDEYVLIFEIARKSRIVVKDTEEIEKVSKALEHYLHHRFKKRYLITTAPLCSKAVQKLKELGWKVYDIV